MGQPEIRPLRPDGDANSIWWGGHFGDNDHWQNRKSEPPVAFGTLKQINDQLAKNWPNLL